MSMNDQGPVRGVWSSRIALFSVLLLFTSLFLHRIFYLPTPTLFLCLGTVYGLAVLALFLGCVAGVRIWYNGVPGAARVFLGCVVGCLIGILPFFLFLIAKNYPLLNDVTTNTADPPLFKTLAQERRGAANPSLYPSAVFAPLQQTAYPDLLSLKINRSLQDTYDLVLAIIKRLQVRVVSVEPPTDTNPEGRIEAVQRTLVVGFYNDLSIRVRGNASTAVIDLRSASRYGKSDFGYNAHLLRGIMRELINQLGARVSSGTVDTSDPRSSGVSSTQQKNGSPKKGAVDR
ncbi:MAG: DUF1499 domain-containing protein [Hyphomicrobium sp.]